MTSQQTTVASPATPAQAPNQPAPRTRRVKKKFWTDEKIIDGLIRANGNVSDACVILRQAYNHKIGRQTIYNAINASPEVAAIAFQAEGQLFDACYKGISHRAQAGNARDQRLVFGKLKGKHGGDDPQVQRVEISGPDGKPIQTKTEVVADGELTREQIAALPDEKLATLLAAERIKYELLCAASQAAAALAA